MSDKPKETWLPNLVGGVSIWKLAADLNQDRFFDGRLLVPETEGSDSLPVKVRWDVEGLVPLREARASHPEAVATATTDYLAAVERVRKELASEASGYKKFREAFTIPSLEADGEENYFFDPRTQKLCVINWGASPRSLGQKGELVFGYDRFEELMARARGAGLTRGGGAAGAAAGVAAAGAAEAAQGDKPNDDAAKDDKKKKRSPWIWILLALAIIVLIVLAGLLFHGCHDTDDHPDAGLSASNSAGPKDAGADAADAGADAASADAGDAGDAGAGDAGDAGAESDAGDAGDAGANADGGDGGAETDAGDSSDGGGNGNGNGGTGDNSGTPPENGKVYVIPAGGDGLPDPGGALGPDGKPRARPTRPIPFRSHYQPGASAWRISSGADVVDPDYPPVMNNGAFEVYLKPGHTFSEIKVEYKDKNGQWHVH